MIKIKINHLLLAGTLTFVALTICLLCSCGQQNASQNTSGTVKVGSLNGPTSIGLQEMPQEGYEFSKQNQPDALVSDIAAENVDIALVPANVASTIYAKTDGSIKVIDINTLNVLKMLSQKKEFNSSDVTTVYAAGKGTVVQANVEMYLKGIGIINYPEKIKYKSDANEVVASLLNDPNAVGIVNEPVASAALQKNSNLNKIDSFEKKLESLYNNSTPITGVTVVRTKFLEKNKAAVNKFLDDHKASVEKCLSNSQEAKNCNVTFIAGNEMKEKLDSFNKKI